MDVRRLAFVVLFMGSLYAVKVLAFGFGGGVVRASVPAAPEPFPDSACCLIPANRGLRGAA